MRRELRVWAMDPVRRVWTVRHTTENLDDACARATLLRRSGLRVRVTPHMRSTVKIVPLAGADSWAHRHRVAGQMMDTADARKRYKSPG